MAGCASLAGQASLDKLCKPRWGSPATTLVSTVLYMLAATLFYHEAEGWTWIESVYFSMVTMSTVGYGDYSPSTPGARVFTIFFIAIGLVVVFSQIASLVSDLTQRPLQWTRDQLELVFPQRGFDIDGNGRFDYHVPRPSFIYYSKNLLGSLFFVFSSQGLFAGLFVAVVRRLHSN
jgi:voltage-gated potassium channel